eukprot:4017673-Pyramimonas_sp.AAC.1
MPMTATSLPYTDEKDVRRSADKGFRTGQQGSERDKVSDRKLSKTENLRHSKDYYTMVYAMTRRCADT